MKRILVIEDEFQIRSNIEQLLSLSGFSTIGAVDGYTGLQIAKQQLPDLILCDVGIPKLNGYGVLSALRQEENASNIPFVFITAMSDRTHMRQGMELGADDYLTKPFTAEELLKTIAIQCTKQTSYEQRLQKQLNQLRHSFTRTVPHELYTPLHGILGTVQLLVEEHGLIGDAEGLEMVEGIQQSAMRLYRSTQNFLLYAKLELIATDPDRLKQLQCGSESGATSDIIQLVARQKARQYDREQDLWLELQDSFVQLPESRLRKVVEEVIDNAFKFSEAGTRVSIVGQASGDSFHLYVIDHGRGMTMPQIKAIGAYVQFERQTYEQQGSGLGLTIAQRIVELHQGEFLIESIPNKQTIVRIRLRQQPRQSTEQKILAH